MEEEIKQLISLIKWDRDGLVPCVVQDFETKEVLMLAYMNEDALLRTIETKKAHYYSRSRKRLWLKGEESGHTQEVKGLFIDCDNDAILLLVEQKIAACHTGYYSCFYRTFEGGLKVVGRKVFEEEKVYGKSK
ncbi:MAG: phosphoribosyl-AMP cyclohydrolase [Desulfobacterota bacterium]|nr:phosphoribosyl-AMP cyclohydrolase [Thermodesulfobacteriota bacterium]MDW8001744.1 phosphoribosyl-AMP cyclohydrolase [Deltaproteobacteria bacterium]